MATLSQSPHENIPATEALLQLVREFLLPHGTERLRSIRAIRNTQRGAIRSSPNARWIPFTAEETVDAMQTGFRWDARLGIGRLRPVVITDGYKDGHGFGSVKTAGIPVKSGSGKDVDKGELQRYLASIVECPPIIVNNPSLTWEAIGPLTLRVRDQQDPTGATVALELAERGRVIGFQAERPRMLGKQFIPTEWVGKCGEVREWEGMRVPTRLEASWILPEGPFAYVWIEFTSFAISQ